MTGEPNRFASVLGSSGGAAAQARAAVAAVEQALGTTPARLTLAVTDRAWLAPARLALAASGAAMVEVVVAGLGEAGALVGLEAETGGLVSLAGLRDPDATACVRRLGHTAEAAGAQAAAVFAALRAALEAAGGGLNDLCKVTMQITDRAHREAVYAALGAAVRDVWPVSTGLIVPALADPDALFQLDAQAVAGGPHQRFRRYRSRDIAYGREVQAFDMAFCMAVRAGRRVLLRGQTGMTLGKELVGFGDPARQAHQALDNVRALLAEAGADPAMVTRMVIYVTDRAYLAPVRAVLRPAFSGAAVAEWVVKGLAAPELMMEVDVHAIVPA